MYVPSIDKKLLLLLGIYGISLLHKVIVLVYTIFFERSIDSVPFTLRLIAFFTFVGLELMGWRLSIAKVYKDSGYMCYIILFLVYILIILIYLFQLDNKTFYAYYSFSKNFAVGYLVFLMAGVWLSWQAIVREQKKRRVIYGSGWKNRKKIINSII